MDVFPTEVWTLIATFACNDNGTAGRALSLTCWNLYDIVKPLKTQSISVIGAKQIVKFAATIERTPAPFRSVRNLFIGSIHPRLDPSYGSNIEPGLADALKALTFLSSESHRFAQPPSYDSSHPSQSILKLDEKAVSEGFCRILELLAPTLINLHAHFTWITRTNILIPVALPILKELTLYGPFLNKTGPSFPSLRRLKLGHYSPCDPHIFISSLVLTAPYLTHLGVPLGPDARANLSEYTHRVTRLKLFVDRNWGQEIAARLKLFLEVDPAFQYPPGLSALALLREANYADAGVEIIEARKTWVDIYIAERDWLERNRGEEGRWCISSD